MSASAEENEASFLEEVSQCFFPVSDSRTKLKICRQRSGEAAGFYTTDH